MTSATSDARPSARRPANRSWSRAPRPRALDQQVRAHLFLISAAALVFRLAYTYQRRDAKLIGDSVGFHLQANLIRDGQWFVLSAGDLEGTYWATTGKPPLYPLYLAASSLLGLDTLLQHRLASTLIGAVLVFTLGWVGYRLAGPRTAVVTAVIAAILPSFWIIDAALLAECLYALFIALTVWAAYALVARPTEVQAVALGLAIGLAGMTRYEGVFLVALLAAPLLWLALPAESIGRRIQLGLVVTLSTCLVLAPWIGFNLGRYEETVLLASPPGTVTVSANCDRTYYGALIGYHSVACASEAQELVASECTCPPGQVCTFTSCFGTDDYIVQQRLFEMGREYMQEHRDRLPAVVLARVGRVWNVYKVEQNVGLDARQERRGTAASWLSVGAFWLLVPAAGLGLVTLRRRSVTIVPLVALAMSATLVVAGSMGITRYRIALDVALVLAGAVGIDHLFRRRSSARSSDPTGAGSPEPVG